MVAMYVYTYYYNGQDVTASNRHIARCLNMPESTCHSATQRLEDNGLIGIRRNGSRRTIDILQPELVECNFYKFESSIIQSNLEIGAKFLFVYILSFLSVGHRFYDTNTNIKANIGLGKDWVASAAQELVRAGLIKILNPKQPRREYYIPHGVNIKNILEQLKSDGFPQSVSKDSVNRINVSDILNAFTSNGTEDSDERLKVPPARTNYVSDYTSNEQRQYTSHQVTELPKVTSEDSFVEDDDLPFPDIVPSMKSDYNLDEFDMALRETMKSHFPDEYEETENTSSNRTKVTFDDLVKTISTASPDSFQGIFQHLQQNNINVCQTMPSGLLKVLRGVQDLSNSIREGKIYVHHFIEDSCPTYFLFNLNIEFPTPSMGFDTRLFSFHYPQEDEIDLIDDQFGMLLVGVKNGCVDIDELTDEERSKLGEIEQLACSNQFQIAFNEYNGTPDVASVTPARYKKRQKDMIIDRMNEDLASTPPSPMG